MSHTDLVLTLRGVSKSFGGLRAVDNVSLEVRQKEIAALIGPNGAGKTTLFNLISGFGAPYAGEIEFAGTRLTGLSPHQVARSGLGRTFQTPAGFPSLSVLENLVVAAADRQLDSPWRALLGLRQDRRAFGRAFATARGLLVDSGIEHLGEALISDLSPGDLKLIEITRQMARRPDLLLLDEPAAAMTVDQIATLTNLIRTIKKKGVGVLVIDHNLGFVFGLADRVHVLESGKLLASGPPSVVSVDPQVREVYLGVEGTEKYA